MLLKVRHKTEYSYQHPTSLSYNEGWLSPRRLPYQIVKDTQLHLTPKANVLQKHTDFFGNEVTFFSLQQSHKYFSIEMESILKRLPPLDLAPPPPSINWEDWKKELQFFNPEWIEIKQFILPSPLVPYSERLVRFGLESFQQGRSLFEAVDELNQRIYQDFEYKQGFTTIATPLNKVIEARKGVCQDFAHVAVSCLRSLGLPARYVSGYIETLPPEGEPELVGSAASHAWFSTYIPGIGWVDFDPTNNQIVKDQHITLAWGRDYSDVPPLKGVIFNSGEHELAVSVEVIRLEE